MLWLLMIHFLCIRSHWSLFAICANNHKKTLGLKGKKGYLLYFDSLGLTDPKECLDVLYR